MVDPPQGLCSLRHLSRKLTHPRFCGHQRFLQRRANSLSPSVMLGFATSRPGRERAVDKEIGYTPWPAGGPLPCLTLSSTRGSNSVLAFLVQGQVNLVDARPQGASDAITHSTPWQTRWSLQQRSVHQATRDSA